MFKSIYRKAIMQPPKSPKMGSKKSTRTMPPDGATQAPVLLTLVLTPAKCQRGEMVAPFV